MRKETLKKIIEALIPGAQFEVDNLGQIVIYTGLTDDGTGELKDFDPEDANDDPLRAAWTPSASDPELLIDALNRRA